MALRTNKQEQCFLCKKNLKFNAFQSYGYIGINRTYIYKSSNRAGYTSNWINFCEECFTDYVGEELISEIDKVQS